MHILTCNIFVDRASSLNSRDKTIQIAEKYHFLVIGMREALQVHKLRGGASSRMLAPPIFIHVVIAIQGHGGTFKLGV